jgi:hypothetical protein
VSATGPNISGPDYQFHDLGGKKEALDAKGIV